MGHVVLIALAAIATALTWLRARRPCAGASRPERAIWLVGLATMALATVLGFSRLSVIYDLVLIFPGALLPTLGQRALGLCGGAAAASLRPSRAAA